MESKAVQAKQNRHSVLSDPRLSQLFELSNQLEVLADSISSDLAKETSSSTSTQRQQQQQYHQPISNGNKTPNNNQPLRQMLPCGPMDISEGFGGGSCHPLITYRRLADESSENTISGSCSHNHQKRFSVVSDDMSTSSGISAIRSHAISPEEGEDLRVDQGAWQTRCVELEESLQKFRDQAQNIREMLREKVRSEKKNTLCRAEKRKFGNFFNISCWQKLNVAKLLSAEKVLCLCSHFFPFCAVACRSQLEKCNVFFACYPTPFWEGRKEEQRCLFGRSREDKKLVQILMRRLN